MDKVKNIIYNEKPLQQAVSQKITIWTTYERMDHGVGAFKLFNKIINELLAFDVKIDDEDKAFILLNSLSQSYDHIITVILYDKETLIFEDVTSTLLSNEIRKMSNQ